MSIQWLQAQYFSSQICSGIPSVLLSFETTLDLASVNSQMTLPPLFQFDIDNYVSAESAHCGISLLVPLDPFKQFCCVQSIDPSLADEAASFTSINKYRKFAKLSGRNDSFFPDQSISASYCHLKPNDTSVFEYNDILLSSYLDDHCYVFGNLSFTCSSNGTLVRMGITLV